MSANNEKPLLSAGLRVCLGLAIETAKQNRHEYLTVEHVLFSLLHDPDTTEIICHCGGDIDTLKERLSKFFDEQSEFLPDNNDYIPEETISLQRVVNRAMSHSLSCEKNIIDGGDILAAMYYEKDSFAVYFLREQGISRFDIINFISHKVSKRSDEFEMSLPVENPTEFEDDGEVSTSTGRSGNKKDKSIRPFYLKFNPVSP